MRFVSPLNNSEIVLETIQHGHDLHVSLYGGEVPHVGAVALAQSRPSLAHEDKVSASVSVITVCGHKEDQVARSVAETIAIHINGIVTVSCGIHFNEIDTYTIIEIRRVTNELVQRLIANI